MGNDIWCKSNGIDYTTIKDLNAESKEKSMSMSHILYRDYNTDEALLVVKEIPTYKMLYKNFLKRYDEAIQQLNNDNEYLTEEELYNLLYTIGMISHPNKTTNEETNEEKNNN